MDAVVLAGGFGTRLAHIVSDVPKPMAPVCGKPFLEYVLHYLKRNGINRVILAVGYKEDVIRSCFGASFLGMDILYSSEDKPLFTGGAIRKALRLAEDGPVFILNGDTYFDVDLRAMLAFHLEKQAALTIAAKKMTSFDRYGTIESENGRITAFLEKRPTGEGEINGGVYLMDRHFLDEAVSEAFSFEKDVMETKVAVIPMYAFASDGYFIDIGIPEDYYRAGKDFAAMGGIS